MLGWQQTSLHETPQFAISNGPKNKNQVQWDVVITMCTTPLRWTSMNCEWDCAKMAIEAIGWKHWNHNMIPKKWQSIMKNSTKFCIFIINHEKIIHEWQIMGEMNSGRTNGGDWQCLTTSKAPKSMLTLHNLTTPIANLQRSFHHHHASSIVTGKILQNPNVLWWMAKGNKGLQGGRSKLNTKQRSLCGKCTRREVEWVWFLLFNDRITNHLWWRWHPSGEGGSHRCEQNPTIVVHLTTHL